MEERDIKRILKRGFPLPDDAFREDLLQRCLSVLGQDENSGFGENGNDIRNEGVEITDDQLDMLAAAGEPSIGKNDNQGGESWTPWQTTP